DPERIQLVGNIMAESVLRNLDRARARAASARFGLAPGEYLLVTVHRPENTDHPERLRAIAAALAESPLPVLLPAHPRTRPLLEAAGLRDDLQVRVVDPVGYLDMVSLQSDAAAVVTDSGGVQEESCMLGTPCVTVRRNTERAVTISAGANRLVRAERDAVLSGIAEALSSPRGWEPPARWDEGVSGRIVDALEAGIVPLEGYREA
ncbi:MAG: UDP-N-acetylglucosamine 2-epimerase (non-hydrolyzing), partial [Coriobacteriaceae bacterium]|nr:UDP-N-acetylglucosamine 2-epimerase (non-hydrolyzing) [Coriobacteriaceae bacterium]